MNADLRCGQIAGVDSSDRLTVPANVLRGVDWWNGEAVEVIAELVQPGLIRAYLADEARPLVEAISSELVEQEMDPQIQFDRIQVLNDRYRPLKMYADGRLRLTKEVAAVLGFSLGQQPTVYVQAFPTGLEIMSLEFRDRRLTQTGGTTIGLHIAKAPPPPRDE